MHTLYIVHCSTNPNFVTHPLSFITSVSAGAHQPLLAKVQQAMEAEKFVLHRVLDPNKRFLKNHSNIYYTENRVSICKIVNDIEGS